MKYITIYLFIFLLQACIQVDNSVSPSKYSVFSILNPQDEKIEVFLAHSYGRNEAIPIDSMKYVDKASVRIHDKLDTVRLRLNPLSKSYESPNNGFLKPGNTYFLEIEIGGEHLSAQTLIPKSVRLVLDTIKVYSNYAEVSVYWLNDTSMDNYYRLTGTVDTGTLTFKSFFWGTETYLYKIKESRNRLIDTLYAPIGNFTFSSTDSKATVTCQLKTQDSNWYEFEGKLDAVQVRNSFTKKFEAPIYFNSNIKNGLGIFGSENINEAFFHFSLSK